VAHAGKAKVRGGRSAESPVDWSKVATVALAGWLVPGLGHWLLGRPGKAIFFLLAIWGTFLTGWALSDCRSVFWKKDRIATYAQMGVGALDLALMANPRPVAAAFGASLPAEPPYEPAGPSENLLPYYDAGTLYTSVAGLLNIVVVISAVSLALSRQQETSASPKEGEHV